MLRESDCPELRRRLLQGGIPRARVARLLRELDDHRHSLREVALRGGEAPDEADSFAARGLGDRDEILASMLAQPQLRAFAHRRSWLVYGLLPCLGLVAGIVLTLIACWAALNGSGSNPLWLRGVIDWVFLFVSHGVLWLIVPGMLWHAHRTAVAPAWPALGALVTICLGSALSLRMAWPAEVDHGGALTIAYRYGLSETLIACAMVALLVLPYLSTSRRSSLREHRNSA